jgi:integrase
MDRRRKMTPAWVAAVKPEAEPVEYPDEAERGLVLRVQPTGRKTWYARYTFKGKDRRYRLGPFPALSLKDARAAARRKVGQAAHGTDPQAERTQHRMGDTVAEVAASWLRSEDTRSWRPRSRAGFVAHLRLRILPALGRMKLAEVKQADVQAMLDRVERVVTRNRTFETARMLFGWAVARRMLAASPCAGVSKLHERARTRTLTDEEIRQVVGAFDSTRFGRYLRLLFLTGGRRDEVLRMRRADLDRDRAVWTIPPEAEKSGETRTEARKVALSAAALEVIAAQLEANMARGLGGARYLFTGSRGERLNRAAPKPVVYRLKGLRDNGTRPSAHRLAKVRPVLIPADFRLHDIRRTVSDRMVNDLGLSAYVVDVGVLGHAKPRLMGTYMPGVPWSELRAAMDAWAAEFARIVGAPRDAASGPVVAEPAVEHV